MSIKVSFIVASDKPDVVSGVVWGCGWHSREAVSCHGMKGT